MLTCESRYVAIDIYPAAHKTLWAISHMPVSYMETPAVNKNRRLLSGVKYREVSVMDQAAAIHYTSLIMINSWLLCKEIISL